MFVFSKIESPDVTNLLGFLWEDKKGLKTTIAKASTIANSFRTTVPAAIINQFNLKDGDKLDWELKAINPKIIMSPLEKLYCII